MVCLGMIAVLLEELPESPYCRRVELSVIGSCREIIKIKGGVFLLPTELSGRDTSKAISVTQIVADVPNFLDVTVAIPIILTKGKGAVMLILGLEE